jgi:hypothetical protein
MQGGGWVSILFVFCEIFSAYDSGRPRTQLCAYTRERIHG